MTPSDQTPRLSRRAALQMTALAGLASLAGTPAWSQANPNSIGSGTIRLVVPFPAGSGTDSAARAYAKAMAELTGQPVVVENKAGANGVIAVQAVLQAPADGTTILLGSNSTLSTNAALIRNLPYDPLRDLAPLGVIARAPCVVIVPANSPHKQLSDLIAAGRKQPGKLTFGSGSPSYQLYTHWLDELAGMQGYNVPYKGAPDVLTAIVAGQLDYVVVDFTAATPLIQAGRVRALALTDEQRSHLLPDLPTSKEAGLPEFLAFNWSAAAVSAKTPAPLLRQIETVFTQAGKSKDVTDLLVRLGLKPTLSSAAEMRKFQSDEIARWKRLATAAKMQVE